MGLFFQNLQTLKDLKNRPIFQEKSLMSFSAKITLKNEYGFHAGVAHLCPNQILSTLWLLSYRILV